MRLLHSLHRSSLFAHSQTFHHDPQILPVQCLKLSKPLPLSTIFPPSITTPPAHRDDLPHPKNADPEETVENTTIISSAPPSGTVTPNGVNGTAAKAKKGKGPLVDTLKYVDYRYYRFLLHPEGEFRMVR